MKGAGATPAPRSGSAGGFAIDGLAGLAPAGRRFSHFADLLDAEEGQGGHGHYLGRYPVNVC